MAGERLGKSVWTEVLGDDIVKYLETDSRQSEVEIPEGVSINKYIEADFRRFVEEFSEEERKEFIKNTAERHRDITMNTVEKAIKACLPDILEIIGQPRA